jgi:Planctomycete cytochrome C
MNAQRWVMLAAAAASLLAVSACQRSAPTVSYQKDVVPILDKHCKVCHLQGQAGYVVSGFDLGSYETLMKGTQFGPVVLPGDPLTSVLVMLIEGRVDPSLRMPHGDATTPSADEILTIRRWVEQGAKNN